MTMTDLSPGTAIECVECGEISEVSGEAHHTGEECPACGDYATFAVTVEACPNGEGCTDDDHHYGVHMHVIEVGE